MGCRLTYSVDHPEGDLTRFFRRALRRFLGFDILHAYRNRRRARAADVIWTYTEYEGLAITLLFGFSRRRNRPKIIAQSVHLFDRWDGFPSWKKLLYQRILAHADLLTVQSDANIGKCRATFPSKDCRLVKFGISIDDFPMTPPSFHPSPEAIKIASLGNDMHRDWETLLEAFGSRAGITMKIAIPRPPQGELARRFHDAANCALISLKAVTDICALYAWADVVVIPLRPNIHASGITVITEAVTQGKPVIAANTGGLNGYFPNEILYYQTGNVESLRNALQKCMANTDVTLASISAAQQRLVADKLTSFGFAQCQVALSHELLGAGNVAPAP